MPDILLFYKSTAVVSTYRQIDADTGNSFTSFGNFPLKEEWIYGSGVQRTPNFKMRKGQARLQPGPNYNKWGYTEVRGPRNAFSNYTQSANGAPNPEAYWDTAHYVYDLTVSRVPTLSPSILEPETLALLDEALRAAKSKLLNTLKGDGANLANMLGERKQVANSVTSLLRRLGNAALALRRGDITGVTRYLFTDGKSRKIRLKTKDIANQWLELQYAWKPICSDIYSLVEGLHLKEASRLFVFRESSKRVYYGNSTLSYGTDPNSKQVGRFKSECIAKYVIWATPDGILHAPASLGFTNPLGVAWEVTPFSFLVDWALPIGKYFDQLSADHGWSFSWGMYSYLVREQRDVFWDLRQGPDSAVGSWPYFGRVTTNESGDNGTGSSKYWQFNRWGLTGFPSPDRPRFKNPLSFLHLANALALVSQGFKGRR